jgi:hypothetical protein
MVQESGGVVTVEPKVLELARASCLLAAGISRENACNGRSPKPADVSK